MDSRLSSLDCNPVRDELQCFCSSSLWNQDCWENPMVDKDPFSGEKS